MNPDISTTNTKYPAALTNSGRINATTTNNIKLTKLTLQDAKQPQEAKGRLSDFREIGGVTVAPNSSIGLDTEDMYLRQTSGPKIPRGRDNPAEKAAPFSILSNTRPPIPLRRYPSASSSSSLTTTLRGSS